ncbi:ribosome production factor 1 isoform X1 [Alligator sinensis]|uniref:Ribosome production factor 1 n=1 Tax=Alligator sinensis TaxID=38654 RepID=A0A3Q0H5J1_ALLSI|nr:ribosome production factor 1 isoform X1 [Alligator sinensis]
MERPRSGFCSRPRSACPRSRTSSGGTSCFCAGSSSRGRRSWQIRKSGRRRERCWETSGSLRQQACDAVAITVFAADSGIAPPKPVPKTIENQRVYDETTVDPNDEEVAFDEATDEFAPYFNRQTVPKILITTSDRPRGRTVRFCEQLSSIVPNSHVYYRRGLALKKIIPQCIARNFTDLIVVNEDRKIPNGLVLSHLPDGPTAHFKMSSVRLRKEIKRKGKEPTEHIPEVILNNFTTRLGHSVGRMLASLFPHDPQFIGRQVATFHNQRDYIFFRFHRYIFKSEKKVGIQELGPRFTLKLRSIQKGTFDSKFGEYEWIHKHREMDTSRRKFHL